LGNAPTVESECIAVRNMGHYQGHDNEDEHYQGHDNEDEDGDGGSDGYWVFLVVLVLQIVFGALFGTCIGVHYCKVQDKLSSIAISSGAHGFLSFGCILIAIASFAHRPPSDEEADKSECDLNDRWWDRHALQMLIFGLAATIVGTFGLIGAGLGVVGAQRRNYCCLVASAITSGFAGGVSLLFFFGGVGQLIEGAQACPNPCGNAQEEDTHCCWGHDCTCRAAIEWACETWSIGMASMVVFVLLGALAVLTSSCGCGATCCCLETFGMIAQPPNPGNLQAAVVGQPVASAVINVGSSGGKSADNSVLA